MFSAFFERPNLYLDVDPFKSQRRGRLVAPCFFGHGSIRIETTKLLQDGSDHRKVLLRLPGQVRGLLEGRRYVNEPLPWGVGITQRLRLRFAPSPPGFESQLQCFL